MKIFYDFHMHSCLSPCGDDEMTPFNAVNMAALLGLSAIALTDHNSCKNCPAAAAAAQQAGITFLAGMELCTAEEAHVVCLFPTLETAMAFDETVSKTLPPIENQPNIFGNQIICDERDEAVGMERILLTTASSISADDIFRMVYALGGVAFPAHIDRPSYSIPAALGDLPPLGFSAVEISQTGDIEALKTRYTELADKPLLKSSDAHRLEDIAEPSAYLELPENTPAAILAALRGEHPCLWSRG